MEVVEGFRARERGLADLGAMAEFEEEVGGLPSKDKVDDWWVFDVGLDLVENGDCVTGFDVAGLEDRSLVFKVWLGAV